MPSTANDAPADLVTCSGPRTEWQAATCPDARRVAFQAGLPAYQFTLVDEAGYYAFLLDEYGIEKSWITLGRYLTQTPMGCWQDPNPALCVERYGIFWTGFPIAANVVIRDPKAFLSTNFQNMKDISFDVSNTFEWAKMRLSQATVGQLLNSLIMPALFVQTAVTSMEAVVQLAQEIEANRSKSKQIEEKT